MAITSETDFINAAKRNVPHFKTTTMTTVAATWYSMFAIAGDPGAGVLLGGETTPPANTAGRVPTDAIPGYPVIPFSANRTYISRLEAASTLVGRIAIYDRLWVGGGYSFNSNINVTSGSWASRVSYNGGSADYSGLEIWVETVTAPTGNLAVNVSYTDQGGAAGATGAVGIGAAPGIGRCWNLPLASGDYGLSAITNVTASVATVGTNCFNVMVLRPIFQTYIPIANQVLNFNYVDLGLPEIFNDSALYFMINVTTGTSSGVPWLGYQFANG
jgi:hypothetical protein